MWFLYLVQNINLWILKEIGGIFATFIVLVSNFLSCYSLLTLKWSPNECNLKQLSNKLGNKSFLINNLPYIHLAWEISCLHVSLWLKYFPKNLQVIRSCNPKKQHILKLLSFGHCFYASTLFYASIRNWFDFPPFSLILINVTQLINFTFFKKKQENYGLQNTQF